MIVGTEFRAVAEATELAELLGESRFVVVAGAAAFAVTLPPKDELAKEFPKLKLDVPLAEPEEPPLLAEPTIPAPFDGEVEPTETIEEAELLGVSEPWVVTEILLAMLETGLAGV